jgi:Beta-propeller repeat
MFELVSILALSYLLMPVNAPLALPITFESNAGQISDKSIRFFADYGSTLIYFKGSELIVLNGGVEIARVRWEGGNPTASLEGIEPAIEERSYFAASEHPKWRSSIYKGVHVRELYPGIDLSYSFQGDYLKLNLVVAPGADLGSVKFETVGNKGSKLNADGALEISTDHGSIHLSPLFLYERTSGHTMIKGGYRLDSMRTGHIELGSHNSSESVEADSEIEFWGDLVKSELPPTRAIARDQKGNTYLARETNSIRLLEPAAQKEEANARISGLNAPIGSESHVLISVIPIDKSQTTCSAYIEGNGSERPYGIATDESGNAYVTGDTASSDFPTTKNAFQPRKGGGWDAFVLKLAAGCDGMSYASYLGGEDEDRARAIAVDSAGQVFVAGYTKSSNFPQTVNAHHRISSFDAFVAKLTPEGKLLQSATFGGRFDDYAFGIAIDGQGNPFVAGQTNSTDFPVTGGSFQSQTTGFWGGFVAKLDGKSLRIQYATFLGGRGTTYVTGIAVDGNDSTYVTGYTNATNFPVTPDAVQQRLAGGFDAFVTKLDPAGQRLVYSTYLGGEKDDKSRAIAVDHSGTACVAGQTFSLKFDEIRDSTSPLRPAGFVACLDPLGSHVTHSALFSENLDDVYAIALSPSSIWVSGLVNATVPASNATVVELPIR